MDFKLKIEFILNDGTSIKFNGSDNGESLVGGFLMDVSPKELGTSKSIDELVEKLENSISSNYYEEDTLQPFRKLMNKESGFNKLIMGDEVKCIACGGTLESIDDKYVCCDCNNQFSKYEIKKARDLVESALLFIDKVKDIKDVNDIDKIIICGDGFERETYTYDLRNKKYTLVHDNISDNNLKCDGGCLFFMDYEETKNN